MKRTARVIVFPKEREHTLLEKAGRYCCTTTVQRILFLGGTLDEAEATLNRCVLLAERGRKLSPLDEQEVRFHLSRQDLASAEEAVADAEAQRKGVRPAGKHSRRGKYTF